MAIFHALLFLYIYEEIGMSNNIKIDFNSLKQSAQQLVKNPAVLAVASYLLSPPGTTTKALLSIAIKEGKDFTQNWFNERKAFLEAKKLEEAFQEIQLQDELKKTIDNIRKEHPTLEKPLVDILQAIAEDAAAKKKAEADAKNAEGK